MAEATTFTPLAAALGGLLIGLSAVWLMLALGRVAGISGIVRAALWPAEPGRAWRLVFIAAMVAAAWVTYRYGSAFTPRTELPAGLLAAGGLLVGYGTALGSGCTSGHGVCGLARLSLRSLAATLTFLATGMATAVVVHGLAGGTA